VKPALGILLVVALFVVPFGIVGYLEGRWDTDQRVQARDARIGQLEADSAASRDVIDSLTARDRRRGDSLVTWIRAYEVMRRQRDILAGLVP
jgi:hypothetical protein